MSKVILYGTEVSAPCRLALVTGKILGVDIQLKLVDLFKNEHKAEDYMKMNPAGTVPTLEDNGLYLWQSRAILTYLVQKYGGQDNKLYPREPNARALIDNMIFFDDGDLYPRLGEYFYPQMFYGQSANAEKETALKAKLAILDKVLQKHPYVAGNSLTIADVGILSSLSLVEICEYDLSPFPNIKKWMTRVKGDVPQYEEVAKNGMQQAASFFKSSKKN